MDVLLKILLGRESLKHSNSLRRKPCEAFLFSQNLPYDTLPPCYLSPSVSESLCVSFCLSLWLCLSNSVYLDFCPFVSLCLCSSLCLSLCSSLSLSFHSSSSVLPHRQPSASFPSHGFSNVHFSQEKPFSLTQDSPHSTLCHQVWPCSHVGEEDHEVCFFYLSRVPPPDQDTQIHGIITSPYSLHVRQRQNWSPARLLLAVTRAIHLTHLNCIFRVSNIWIITPMPRSSSSVIREGASLISKQRYKCKRWQLLQLLPPDGQSSPEY